MDGAGAYDRATIKVNRSGEAEVATRIAHFNLECPSHPGVHNHDIDNCASVGAANMAHLSLVPNSVVVCPGNIVSHPFHRVVHDIAVSNSEHVVPSHCSDGLRVATRIGPALVLPRAVKRRRLWVKTTPGHS